MEAEGQETMRIPGVETEDQGEARDQEMEMRMGIRIPEMGAEAQGEIRILEAEVEVREEV